MPILRSARLQWTGSGLSFTGQGTEPATPAIQIDAENSQGPGPMLTLLMAAAACSSADVVDILKRDANPWPD
jgi:uncharacterized OsmC-like protein